MSFWLIFLLILFQLCCSGSFYSVDEAPLGSARNPLGGNNAARSALIVFYRHPDGSYATNKPVTGKAFARFAGFVTPRPIPQWTPHRIYGSVWASWTAWSHCANNRQLRVRACNTVRGFRCMGHNREAKICTTGKVLGPRLFTFHPVQHNYQLDRTANVVDYEGFDPWEEDRKIALKQLENTPGLPSLFIPVRKTANDLRR